MRAGTSPPGSPSTSLAAADLVPASCVLLGSINHRGLLVSGSREGASGDPKSGLKPLAFSLWLKAPSHNLAF